MRRLSLHDAIVKDELRSGDVLLFRGKGLVARAIQVAGRGEYSHAAMAIAWGSQLFCVEVREWYGGRAVTLASQVRRYPGQIDAYRVNPGNRWPGYRPGAAARVMLGFAGQPYGYLSVLRASLLHLPGLRWLHRVNRDARPNGTPPFCSQAVAIALNAGGADPTPNLADRLTEPSDLARSVFLEQRVTLI